MENKKEASLFSANKLFIKLFYFIDYNCKNNFCRTTLLIYPLLYVFQYYSFMENINIHHIFTGKKI